MDIRRCQDCREYKYIEKNGLCRDCCQGVSHRFSEYDVSYSPTDLISSGSKNQLILGEIGSGKTVGNKAEIMKILADRDDTRVYITDPLGQYSDFVSEMGGSEYVIDKGDAFNIFDIGRLNKVSQFASKMGRIYDFIIRCYNHLGHSIGPREEQLLQILIEQTYKENGVNQNTKSLNSLPTYSDMLDLAKKIENNPGMITRRNATPTQVSKLKSAMSKLHSRLKEIRDDLNLDYNLNNKSYTGDDLTYFNLGSITGPQTSISIRMIFDQVWEYSIATTDNVVFYIDNAKYLIGKDTTINSLEKCLRHSRHYDTSISLSMAGGKDVLDTTYGRKLMRAIERFRVHRQSSSTDWTKKQLDLSRKETNYIENASIGSNTNHSEVLISSQGNASREKIEMKDSLLTDIH